MLVSFVYHLRDAGIPISVKYAMEFIEAVQKGLAPDLERLFLLARLIFVKKVEYYDAYEQAFASFFLGKTFDDLTKDNGDIFNSRPFREWLKKELEQGNLEPAVVHNIPREELMQMFWDTVLEQEGEHHGGGRWIGTGGTSPFGHSGRSTGGVRVGGESWYRSALKVIGERRYIDYASTAPLRTRNLGQVLQMLKNLVPVGPETELDVDETIYRTAKNGGEIEFCFLRELRNRLKILLFLDNGGYSMVPYVNLVSLVFNKLRGQFDDIEIFYFHNCIYGCVYKNPARTKQFELEKLLEKPSDSRVVIIGDGDMAPAELFVSDGAIDWETNQRITGIDCLKMIADHFKCNVWLNPIPKRNWLEHSPTIDNLRNIFYMEDLTLNGIRNAVDYLNERGKLYSN